MYDRKCSKCDETKIDLLETMDAPNILCTCGGMLERVWLSTSPSVIDDSIIGGVLIRHGVCNDDGTPKRYDTKSAIAKAAKEKGLVNYVVHTPERGSDKSKHTQRWV